MAILNSILLATSLIFSSHQTVSSTESTFSLSKSSQIYVSDFSKISREYQERNFFVKYYLSLNFNGARGHEAFNIIFGERVAGESENYQTFLNVPISGSESSSRTFLYEGEEQLSYESVKYMLNNIENDNALFYSTITISIDQTQSSSQYFGQGSYCYFGIEIFVKNDSLTNVYDNGFSEGAAATYDEAYQAGFEKGELKGISETAADIPGREQAAYDRGYEAGEEKGFAEGFDEGYGAAESSQSYGIDFFSSVLNSVGDFLNREIIPGFRLWYIIAIPMMIALVYGVLKLLR